MPGVSSAQSMTLPAEASTSRDRAPALSRKPRPAVGEVHRPDGRRRPTLDSNTDHTPPSHGRTPHPSPVRCLPGAAELPAGHVLALWRRRPPRATRATRGLLQTAARASRSAPESAGRPALAPAAGPLPPARRRQNGTQPRRGLRPPPARVHRGTHPHRVRRAIARRGDRRRRSLLPPASPAHRRARTPHPGRPHEAAGPRRVARILVS